MANKRNRSQAGKQRSRGGTKAATGGLSPSMQWLLLAGIAALGILAVFIFGIGAGSDATPTHLGALLGF